MSNGSGASCAEYGEHLLADAMAYRAWSGTKNTMITDDSTTVEELRAVSCHPL